MLALLICVAVPFLILGIALFVRWQYGDEIFGLNWPPHELDRDDDYRLVKLRLRSKAPPDADQ